MHRRRDGCVHQQAAEHFQATNAAQARGQQPGSRSCLRSDCRQLGRHFPRALSRPPACAARGPWGLGSGAAPLTGMLRLVPLVAPGAPRVGTWISLNRMPWANLRVIPVNTVAAPAPSPPGSLSLPEPDPPFRSPFRCNDQHRVTDRHRFKSSPSSLSCGPFPV